MDNTAVLVGVFTIAGALIGQVGAWWVNQARVRAEDERRWLVDRRTLYARFVAACHNQKDYHPKKDYDLGPRDLDEVMAEIELMAPVSVATAAQDVRLTAVDITFAKVMDRDSTERTPKERRNDRGIWNARFDQAMVGFLNAARADLGIAGKHAPPGPMRRSPVRRQ